MINLTQNRTSRVFLLLFLSLATGVFGQHENAAEKPTGDFWDHVDFGGGLGVSIGSGFTDIMVAPGAIYNFNDYFAAGVGLQGSYVKVRNEFDSYLYGGSVIGLFNPIEQIQVSVEVEQLRVNTTFNESFDLPNDNFWNTGLFVGLGYRSENITIGARYNLLHDPKRTVYHDALMPFVRVYF